jgi:hypothetical protein
LNFDEYFSLYQILNLGASLWNWKLNKQMVELAGKK